MGQQNNPSDGEKPDDEGPISREELEARNTERSLTLHIEGDVVLKPDGGIDMRDYSMDSGLNQVLDEHAENLNQLATKLVLFGVLLFLSVIFWRLGAVIGLLGA